MPQINTYPVNTAPTTGFRVLGYNPAAPAASATQVVPLGTITAVTLYPSGDPSGATDAANIAAAIAAMPAAGGLVALAPTAQWYIKCGVISVNRSGAYISAAGCWINAVGAGDMIRMFDSSTYGARTVLGGGLLGAPIVDGTLTTGTASAIHFGDILQGSIYVRAQNFTQAGSSAAHLDNQYFWTEQLQGFISSIQCVTGVLFDVNVTGAPTGSFYRCDLSVYINQVNPVYNGVVLQNGALIIDGALSIRGNFGSAGSAAVGAVLVITGQTPAGASLFSFSNILSSRLEIQAECGSGAFPSQTINFGSGNNGISESYGLLDFSQASTFKQSNNSNNLITFYGPILGDPSIVTWLLTGASNAAAGAQLINSTAPANVNGIAGNLTPFTNYRVRAWIPYSATGAAGTPQFAFTVPGAQAAAVLAVRFWSGGALASFTVNSDYTTVMIGPTLTAATTHLLEIEGTITCTAPGTLQLQAAEGTSGDTFSIEAGAYMTVIPMANG